MTLLLLLRPATAVTPPPPPLEGSVGTGLTSFTFDMMGDDQPVALGGAQVDVPLVASDGQIVSGQLGTVQQQGASQLVIRERQINGRVYPSVELPPQAHAGGTQMRVGLIPLTSQTVQAVGENEVNMMVGLETPTRELGIEWQAKAGRVVIINVPPVSEWDDYIARGKTDDPMDPDFFDPTVADGATGVAGNAWK